MSTKQDPQVVDFCAHCGQPIDYDWREVSLSGVTIGRRTVSFLSKTGLVFPAVAHLGRLLLSRRRMSTEALTTQICPDAESEPVRVYVSQLRTVLRQIGAPLKIVSEYGCGYRVDAEPCEIELAT